MDTASTFPAVVIARQHRNPTTKWTVAQLRHAWCAELDNPIQGSQWGQLLDWITIAPEQNLRDLQLPLDSCLDLSQLNFEHLNSDWLAYWKENMQCRVAAIRVSSQRCTLSDLMRLLSISWLDYLEIDTTEATYGSGYTAAEGLINGMFLPTCNKVREWENSGLMRYNKNRNTNYYYSEFRLCESEHLVA